MVSGDHSKLTPGLIQTCVEAARSHEADQSRNRRETRVVGSRGFLVLDGWVVGGSVGYPPRLNWTGDPYCIYALREAESQIAGADFLSVPHGTRRTRTPRPRRYRRRDRTVRPTAAYTRHTAQLPSMARNPPMYMT